MEIHWRCRPWERLLLILPEWPTQSLASLSTVMLFPAVSSTWAEGASLAQFTYQTRVLPSASKMGKKQTLHNLFLPFCFPSATRITHLGRRDCVESNSFQSLPQLSGIESNNEIGQDRSLKNKKSLWKVQSSVSAVSNAFRECWLPHQLISQETFSPRTGISQPPAIAPSPQHLTAFAFLQWWSSSPRGDLVLNMLFSPD